MYYKARYTYSLLTSGEYLELLNTYGYIQFYNDQIL
jgi:hypothetical protein